MGAARPLLDDDALAGDALVLDKTSGGARLCKPGGEKGPFPPDQRQPCLGMAPRQRDAGKYPRHRAVEHGLPVGERQRRVDGAAQHENAVDPFRQLGRPRKPFLQASSITAPIGATASNSSANAARVINSLPRRPRQTRDSTRPIRSTRSRRLPGWTSAQTTLPTKNMEWCRRPGRNGPYPTLPLRLLHGDARRSRRIMPGI